MSKKICITAANIQAKFMLPLCAQRNKMFLVFFAYPWAVLFDFHVHWGLAAFRPPTQRWECSCLIGMELGLIPEISELNLIY